MSWAVQCDGVHSTAISQWCRVSIRSPMSFHRSASSPVGCWYVWAYHPAATYSQSVAYVRYRFVHQRA
eukprot:9400876-Pyramimonas_sp.AAC.1